MARSLYVSILLALALFADHSEAAATGTHAMVRRQQFGVARNLLFSPGIPTTNAAGFSSSTSTQSESYSFSSVMNTYNGLQGEIQNCQNLFGQSGFTLETASKQIQQVAVQFQDAFAQFNACGSCISNNQIGQFRETFSRLFTSFHSLVQTCRERFPNDWQPLFGGSFSSLNENFHQFFSTCRSSGLELHQFVPQELNSFFQQVGMNSAFSSIQQGGSFSSSSSFHSESSVHTEISSIQGVRETYNGLLSQLRSYQGAFRESAFSSETATQHIEQLATQFRAALSQFDGCSACSGPEIQNFRGLFSETFTSFHSLVELYQQRFPDRWHQFFDGSFESLSQDFSKFFNTCQNGGLPVNSFFPQQLGQFFNQVQMTSSFSTLKQYGISF